MPITTRSLYLIATAWFFICGFPGTIPFAGAQIVGARAPAARSDKIDPVFQIKSPDGAVKYKRSELLARKDATTLTLEDDPTFPGRKMTYRAVPLYKLFEGIKIPKEAVMDFECLDGFSAGIETERLLNSSPSGSIAYLAIEQPKEKWPEVSYGHDGRTPAPYYLVWVNPKLSNIGPEEWPYQLSGFSIKEPITARFPNIAPDQSISKDDPIRRGFKLFTKHCFACHTMNKQGLAQMGPDLNVPENPTEYLTENGFETLVRNPQNLRYWPQAKMSPFSTKDLPPNEFSDLVAYLKHMAKRKVK